MDLDVVMKEKEGMQPPKVRSANSGGQKGGDGKRDDGTLPGSTTSSTPASSSLGGSMDSNQGGGGGSASTAPMAAKEMDDFLKNATQVLKLMTDQQAGLGATMQSNNEDAENRGGGLRAEDGLGGFWGDASVEEGN